METASYVTASLRHFVTGASIETDLPTEWTIEHATREISHALGLPVTDTNNGPAYYELFRNRADGPGEKLPPSGTVGDLVHEGDEIVPLPEITPG